MLTTPPSSPAPRWRPRSCSASARAGRSRSTPPRSWSPPRSFVARVRPRARGHLGGARGVSRTSCARASAKCARVSWIWVTIAVFAVALMCTLRAPGLRSGRPSPRSEYGSVGAVRPARQRRSAAARCSGALPASGCRPLYPMRIGLPLRPAMAGGDGRASRSGLPLALLLRRSFVARRRRSGAVRRVVGDRARPAHPAAHALARLVVRLDGLAGAAPRSATCSRGRSAKRSAPSTLLAVGSAACDGRAGHGRAVRETWTYTARPRAAGGRAGARAADALNPAPAPDRQTAGPWSPCVWTSAPSSRLASSSRWPGRCSRSRSSTTSPAGRGTRSPWRRMWPPGGGGACGRVSSWTWRGVSRRRRCWGRQARCRSRSRRWRRTLTCTRRRGRDGSGRGGGRRPVDRLDRVDALARGGGGGGARRDALVPALHAGGPSGRGTPSSAPPPPATERSS